VEEMDMNLSTTLAKENDLEKLYNLFTKAMQKQAGKLKIINTQNKTKQNESVP